ncbi:hypothetical protein TNCV_4349001 [Trichonephila clavipes]|nr:hypothetical protein TNCV_4349001 [Trichonephila clavipes]
MTQQNKPSDPHDAAKQAVRPTTRSNQNRQTHNTQQSKPSDPQHAAIKAVRPATIKAVRPTTRINQSRQTHNTQQSKPPDPNDATATTHTFAITAVLFFCLSTDSLIGDCVAVVSI